MKLFNAYRLSLIFFSSLRGGGLPRIKYFMTLITISLTLTLMISIQSIATGINNNISNKFSSEYPLLEYHDFMIDFPLDIKHNKGLMHLGWVSRNNKDHALTYIEVNLSGDNTEIVNKYLPLLSANSRGIILSERLKNNISLGDTVLLTNGKTSNQQVKVVLGFFEKNQQFSGITLTSDNIPGSGFIELTNNIDPFKLSTIIHESGGRAEFWASRMPGISESLIIQSAAVKIIHYMLFFITSIIIISVIISVGVNKNIEIAIMRMAGASRFFIFSLLNIITLRVFILSAIISVWLSHVIVSEFSNILKLFFVDKESMMGIIVEFSEGISIDYELTAINLTISFLICFIISSIPSIVFSNQDISEVINAD